MNGGSRDPAASGSDRHANSVQLPPHGPCVYAEDRCNHGEGVAGLVPAGGIADVPRAHPALVCAPRNSEQLELRCDRVVVYVEELGDGSERPTRPLLERDLLDIEGLKSALHWSGSGV